MIKQITNYVRTVTSELDYWKQINTLQTELEKVNASLYESNQESYGLMIENDTLKAELLEAKSELKDANSAYQSLLKDYYQMMDRHREFKRNLATNEVSVKSL